MRLIKRPPGRPRKYDRPTRVVTVTLPEDVLAHLSGVEADLGRAIVALVERQAGPPRQAAHLAEIATYGSHAVIVVRPVKALQRIAGVQLVPIGRGRALISLGQAHSIAQLELDIRDAIDRDGAAGVERKVLEAVADILRQARSSRTIRLEERSIIVLETKRPRVLA